MEIGNSIKYKEARHDEEINFEATTIVDLHQRRIKQIELVLDDHLLHLHGKAGISKFSHLTPEQKLRYLLGKQEYIDKDQRMRLVDIT
jgi:hypothetical protein